MSKPFWVLTALAAALSGQISAENLQFLYQDGEQYRYYGESSQTVLYNGRELQKNSDSYKTSYKIHALPDGKGQYSGKTVYISLRKSTTGSGAAAQVTEESDNTFVVDRLGYYTITPDMVYPVVRNVPVFPDHDLKEGDTWVGRGEEFQDLSAIQEFSDEGLVLPPQHIPVDVSYTYLGPQDKDGKTLQVIEADYNIFFRIATPKGQFKSYPSLLAGYSHKKVFFNSEKGRIDSYAEDYVLDLVLNAGDVYEFRGDSHADLVEAKEMDKPALVDEVKKGLTDKGLGNLDVHTSDQGVVINLDNIQFPADSDLLIPSEQDKLRLIGDVLKKYPDRDILVEGHTALAGTVADRQKLSEDRAAAVGNFLVSNGVRTPEKIVYRGWGAEKPLVPNDSEENRKKNRRVEITILEN